MSEQTKKTEEVISTERLIAIELNRAVARFSDLQGEKAEQLLDNVFSDRGPSSNQINGLLSVVVTSPAIASVTRFIERQAARREAWQRNNLAMELLSEIKSLQTSALNIAMEIQKRLRERYKREGQEVDALTNKQSRLPEIHYLLAREFIQSFAIGYLYRYVRQPGQEKREEED